MDTIYAVASGRGPCGVTVLRVSGPAVQSVLETMIGSVPEPRRASMRSIRDRNGGVLDHGLVLWFPGPGSFTGEDVVEFQVHGSRAVVAAVERSLAQVDGVRPAEAGEFTRRAFVNGRIDLTEAEGLADLLAAETDEQRRQALAQSDGGLRVLYEGWRGRLIRARALIEADLDFADEEDIPGSVVAAAEAEVGALIAALDGHLADGHRGERLRSGFRVVLAGAPNAGKSSLLNALARRDVAIVSEEAGTTRDILEVHLDLGGWPVTVVDTAGLRDGGGAIEREGMRRARERIDAADLVLWLTAADGSDAVEGRGVEVPGGPVWRVVTKSDLVDRVTGDVGFETDTTGFRVSVRTGDGLGALVAAVGDAAGAGMGGGGVAPTRERHRVGVETAATALRQAYPFGARPLEIVAEDLRRAGDALGRLNGRVDVEDLLDVVFGEFCIGK